MVARLCRCCRRELPVDQFYKSSSRRDGLQLWCRECCKVQLREYRRSDRERWNARDRKYRADYWRKNPKRCWAMVACSSAKTRAKRAGLPFGLTPEILLPLCKDVCPVLGVPLAYERSPGRGIHAGSPTVDRLDNALGYVAGNVLVVSYRVNRIKNDATLDELKRVLAFYEEASR